MQHFRTALPLVKALGVPFYVHAELPHEVPASEVTHLCPALSLDPKGRLAACRPYEVYTPAGLPHNMPAPWMTSSVSICVKGPMMVTTALHAELPHDVPAPEVRPNTDLSQAWGQDAHDVPAPEVRPNSDLSQAWGHDAASVIT